MLQPNIEKNIPLDEQIIEFLKTLQDNHCECDQQWIRALLESGANNTPSEVVKLGTLIQTTILDTVIEKLLNINPYILTKVALVEDYICQIWKFNNLKRETLYNYILEDSQRQAILNLI